jgi:hypothetical protein
VAGVGFVDPTHDGEAVMDGAPGVVAADAGLGGCNPMVDFVEHGAPGVVAGLSSSKTDQMTWRVHLEVSLAPQGVVPPRDS